MKKLEKAGVLFNDLTAQVLIARLRAESASASTAGHPANGVLTADEMISRCAEEQRDAANRPAVVSLVSELERGGDGVRLRGVTYRAERLGAGTVRIDTAINAAARAAGLVGQEIGAFYSAAQRLAKGI